MSRSDAGEPWLTRLARTLGLATLEAASVGLGWWAIISPTAVPEFTRQNSASEQSRHYTVLDMGMAVGVGLLLLAAVFVWKRREGLGVLERLVRRSAPLAVAGLVPFLFDTRLWDGRDLEFLIFAAVFGFGAWAAAGSVLETPPLFPRLRARARSLLDRARPRVATVLAKVDAPLLVAAAGACAYAVYFSAITIVNHRNLGTCSFDLGLEDNLMWNLVHGGPIFKSTPFDGPTGTHLRNHATFFSYVLAPIYWLAPRPETLLVVQAAMMGGAAIPLHLYARRHVPAWTATLVALLYLFYPPLHGANLYDFHYLPLGVLFLWLVLYAVEARRRVLAVVAAVLALSVREDVAFCLGVLGLFLLLTGAAARAGAALAAVGVGYFLVMKLGVMPHFGTGGESFVNQYSGLVPPEGHGFGSILETIVGNPVFTGSATLDGNKLPYVLQIFVPLLFVPLTRRIALLLVLPGFVFTLLSTGYAPLTEISFQYTTYWTAFVFLGVVLALQRRRQPRYDLDAAGPRRQAAMVVGLVAASLACSSAYGAILHRDNVRGGFDRARIAGKDTNLIQRARLDELIAEIPKDARVCASERLVPHVSSREDAYTLRFGVYDADYLLFQMPMRGDERDKAMPLLRDGTFGVVDDRSDMVLARRGEPTLKNAAVFSR
jgi:uncharacterized membrane protein